MAQRSSNSKNQRHVSGNPANRNRPRTNTAAPVRQPRLSDWLGAARLRTLPLAVAPVILGTGAAVRATREFDWLLIVLCFAVAVLLQIGVNFANDYSDGIRGTDDERVGPQRLTASGLVAPRRVLTAALVTFALAGLAGLAITIITQQWWLIAVGAVSIVAAWFYTGGKRPYGYFALGEVFVFIFFGLVATLGTTWVQAQVISQEAWAVAIAAGLFACAVLLANNLRDIDQDRAVGKRTLTVLIGRRATQIVYTLFVVCAFVIAAWLALFYPIATFAGFALLPALPAIAIVWSYRTPKELVLALALTSVASVVYAIAVAWALIG